MDAFDKLLQEHPMTIPVRKSLAADTMTTIVQIKRIRLARRMLSGLLVIATLLLIVKWLNNDLLYLVQLSIYKFSFIKTQSSLYMAALLESLPKQQMITLLLASILWLGWKRFETFLFSSR